MKAIIPASTSSRRITMQQRNVSKLDDRQNFRSWCRARSMSIKVRADSNQNGMDLRLHSGVVAAVFSCLMIAHPAQAREHIWMPRRHHRRLGEKFDDNWTAPIIEKMEEEERLLKAVRMKELEAARIAAQQRKALKQVQREERQRKLEGMQRSEQYVRKAKELLMSVATAPRAVGEFVTDHIGVANLGIFLALVLALIRFVLAEPLAAIWRFLCGEGWRAQGGKWVYDRSLGGKKVWVADQPVSTTPVLPSTEGSNAPQPPTRSDPAAQRSRMTDADFEVLTRMAAAATRPTALDEMEDPSTVPEWWKVPVGGNMSEASRAEKLAAADRLVRSIEKKKVGGEDYPLELLVRLRDICQDGWVTVAPATVGGRDAMYRTGVEGAIRAAMDPVRYGKDLGGWSPQQLVAGLAQDLIVSDDRALKIARSCIAAEMRTRLVDVVAAMKKADIDSLMLSLLQLADLQRNLPVLSPNSAEIELIASSLNSRATLQQRQAILEVAAQLAPESAALFAALLGFDARLVLPQLASKLGMQRSADSEKNT